MPDERDPYWPMVERVLERAGELIGSMGWTRGANARKAPVHRALRAGLHCSYDSPEAVCFCANGAILRAAAETAPKRRRGEAGAAAQNQLLAVINRQRSMPLLTIPQWNDEYAASKESVVEALATAAATCRA